jgi:hypothetical protein
MSPPETKKIYFIKNRRNVFLSQVAAVVQGKSVKERKKMLLLEIIFHKNLKRKT